MVKKRLFLFAGYNKSGIITPAVVYYISELAKIGDVVACFDCDCTAKELQKVAPFVVSARANRHGEYDWGSYKRAYLDARGMGILQEYEYVYLVNDSVYGPLTPLLPHLEFLEHGGQDAFGLVGHISSNSKYIQSWFIGCRRGVFLSQWFDDFMSGIRKLNDKGGVVALYEKGFSQQLVSNGFSWNCEYTTRHRAVYNKIGRLYRAKMPFIKKISFTRCAGALGRQFLYVFNHVSPKLRDIMMQSAYIEYGKQYVDWFLTDNLCVIAYRRVRHFLRKIFIEGI